MADLLTALQTLAGQRISPRGQQKDSSQAGPILLQRQRIYILPSKQGVVFAVILFTMLLGSLNYNNSMGFALTFLLAGIGFIAIHHTYRNLVGLEISAGKTTPVFQGEVASFTILIKNPTPRERRALILQLQQQLPVFARVAALGSSSVTLSQLARQRGVLPMARLTVSTRFPLGLLCAWAQLRLDARCLVYPAPRGEPHDAHPLGDIGQQLASAGEDDFAGQREYRPGDALSRVNWKAAARGHGLLTKEFSGADQGALWFDWAQFPTLETEARLSQLCQLLLTAEQTGQYYGLRLPQRQILPDTGHAHQQLCLKALALYDAPAGNQG